MKKFKTSDYNIPSYLLAAKGLTMIEALIRLNEKKLNSLIHTFRFDRGIHPAALLYSDSGRDFPAVRIYRSALQPMIKWLLSFYPKGQRQLNRSQTVD